MSRLKEKEELIDFTIKIMQEACFELARYVDSCQAHFAVETGPETPLTLKGFLDELGFTGVAGIYGVSESEMLQDTAFIELSLGEGDVPFKELITI